jgi:tetratricopeptide (TPR) repeat protein
VWILLVQLVLEVAEGSFALDGSRESAASDLYINLGDRHGQASCLLNLGRVHHQNGKYDLALDLLTQAHDLFTDINDLTAKPRRSTASAISPWTSLRRVIHPRCSPKPTPSPALSAPHSTRPTH